MKKGRFTNTPSPDALSKMRPSAGAQRPMEDFRVVTHEVVDCPGLHSVRELILAEAEASLAPTAFPSYTQTEISRFFLFEPRAARRMDEWPPPTHSLYSDPPERHGERYVRYTLPTVERLVHYWNEIDMISWNRFIHAKQVIAWTARGWGLAV